MMYTNWMQPQQVTPSAPQPSPFAGGRVAAPQNYVSPLGNLAQQEFGQMPAPQMNPGMGQPGTVAGGFAGPMQRPGIQSMPGPGRPVASPMAPAPAPPPAQTNWMNRGGGMAVPPANGTTTSLPMPNGTTAGGMGGDMGGGNGVYSPIGQQPMAPPQQFSPMAPAQRPPARFSPMAPAQQPPGGLSPMARGGLFGMRR